MGRAAHPHGASTSRAGRSLGRESVINMVNSGINHFIEIGPGKVLSGLVKRISKEVKIDTINSQGDIESLKI